MKKTKTMVVGFPLYDGVTLMDFCGATDVFAFPRSAEAAFIPIWLAAEKKPVITSEGTYVYPNYSFTEKHPQIDLLFVPGGTVAGVTGIMFNETYQSFIKKTATTATWVGSVCVGAFILAAAGLLKKCSATTYWSQVPNLALLKKKFNLKIPRGNPRGIVDKKRKIFTGGGISSSIDLALMLLEAIKGKAYAQSSQLYMQYAPRPPVHAGDPEQAPKKLVKKILQEQAGYTAAYYAAVQKILQQKTPAGKIVNRK